MPGEGAFGSDGIETRNDHQGDHTGSVTAAAVAQVGMKGRQYFHAADFDSRRSQRDHLEVVGGHQAIAMLQIAGNLLFAVVRSLRIRSAPGRNRIRNRESSRDGAGVDRRRRLHCLAAPMLKS